ELWNLANNPKYYSGDIPTLVEMTRRAVHILRRTDPQATTVCPSMGELWNESSRDFLTRFAAAWPKRSRRRPDSRTEQLLLIRSHQGKLGRAAACIAGS